MTSRQSSGPTRTPPIRNSRKSPFQANCSLTTKDLVCLLFYFYHFIHVFPFMGGSVQLFMLLIGLYPLVSKFNHNCAPNVSVEFADSSTAFAIASRGISSLLSPLSLPSLTPLSPLSPLSPLILSSLPNPPSRHTSRRGDDDILRGPPNGF